MDIKGQPQNPEDRKAASSINKSLDELGKYNKGIQDIITKQLEELRKLSVSNGQRMVKIMDKDVRMDSLQLSGVIKRSPQILLTFASQEERDNFFKNFKGL